MRADSFVRPFLSLLAFSAPLALLGGCADAVSASAATGDGGSRASDGGEDARAFDGSAPPADGAVVDGCAGLDAAPYGPDAGDGGPVVGAPCVPESESSPTFDGFSNGEIWLGRAASSGAPACIAYHFRGLVTCPYGQSATGVSPAGAPPCATACGVPVIGAVPPQCAERRAAAVVLWTCRCANVLGKTDDGDSYCACPGSTTCAQGVMSSIGTASDHVSGAYCLPAAIVSDAGGACSVSCDPVAAPCP